jgi:hypothetical protein
MARSNSELENKLLRSFRVSAPTLPLGGVFGLSPSVLNFPRCLAPQNSFGRPLRLPFGWQPAEDLEALDLPATPFRQANEKRMLLINIGAIEIDGGG